MINTDLHPRRNQVTTPRVGDVWIHGNGKTAVVTGAFTSMDGLFDEPRISLDGGAPAYIGWLVGQGWDPYELAEYAQLRRERDAALAEQRRAVARLAEVSAERDRLLAVVVAQAEAWERWGGSMHGPLRQAWLDATERTEALGREMRGAR